MEKRVLTSEFPYCNFSFTYFNPVQSACFEYFCMDCNLLVSAEMASGKSAIAEAIFAYELSQNKDSKVCYISPLKALSNEKYNNWKEHLTFQLYNISVLSGESRLSDEEVNSSQIILSTIESFDICLRKQKEWIKTLRVVVFDEAHFLSDDTRGIDAEAFLMNLTLINPECRIVLLSGTMNNVKELAIWIKSLNGKQTKFIKSSWRPATLEKSVLVVEYFDKVIETIKEIVYLNPFQKILIFVHSKKIGEQMVKNFSKLGIKSVFFKADLKPYEKERIIQNFKDDKFSVIISTSSLGAGVDL